MIIDTFKRGAAYDLGPLWEKIFPELVSLIEKGGHIQEGKLLLAGGPEKGGVSAKVETYAPKSRENALYEGHTAMADVQITLEGDEYIDVFPLRGDEEKTLQDDARDLVLFAAKPEASVRVHLRPGIFALIMPGEAHMPCLMAGSSAVRKLVVKIPANLLCAPAAL